MAKESKEDTPEWVRAARGEPGLLMRPGAPDAADIAEPTAADLVATEEEQEFGLGWMEGPCTISVTMTPLRRKTRKLKSRKSCTKESVLFLGEPCNVVPLPEQKRFRSDLEKFKRIKSIKTEVDSDSDWGAFN